MNEQNIYEEKFSKRLAQLHMNKGVSARDMSLSIGQNAGYINNIENGKALPSMTNFFIFANTWRLHPWISSTLIPPIQRKQKLYTTQ